MSGAAVIFFHHLVDDEVFKQWPTCKMPPLRRATASRASNPPFRAGAVLPFFVKLEFDSNFTKKRFYRRLLGKRLSQGACFQIMSGGFGTSLKLRMKE